MMPMSQGERLRQQIRNIKWNLNIIQSTLHLEAFNQDTKILYQGKYPGSQVTDLTLLQIHLQNGQFNILLKSTTQLKVLVGFITITLNSQTNLQITQLKLQITQLKLQITQLKSKVVACQLRISDLETTIDQLKANSNKWDDVNLDRKTQFFNPNYDYKIFLVDQLDQQIQLDDISCSFIPLIVSREYLFSILGTINNLTYIIKIRELHQQDNKLSK